MDFLEKITLDNEELITLAYQRYLDDLNTKFLYIFEEVKNLDSNNQKKEINKLFLEHMPNFFKDLESNNPIKFAKLDCYKLILCSSFYSPWWNIHYSNMYKYYYDMNKNNPEFTVDLFIGKIEALFQQGNDSDFTAFERLVNLKYKKLKLEDL